MNYNRRFIAKEDVLKILAVLLVCFLCLAAVGCSHKVVVVKSELPVYKQDKNVTFSNENFKSSEMHLAKAKQYYLKGQYKQAQHHCELAVKFNHNNWEAHYYMGLSMLKKREYAHSIEALKIGLRLGPDNKFVKSEMHYYLALSFEEMGRPEEALDEYKQALVFNSGNQLAQNGLNRIKVKKTMKDWKKEVRTKRDS